MALTWPKKDPDAVLDYSVDWAEWLEDDTISVSTYTVPVGLTKASSSNTPTVTTVWLSGGVAGTSYFVLNRVVTTGGRTDERTIKVTIKEK